jgi:hypothetical protein
MDLLACHSECSHPNAIAVSSSFFSQGCLRQDKDSLAYYIHVYESVAKYETNVIAVLHSDRAPGSQNR